MEKPISLKIKDFKNNAVNLVNTSGLPLFVVEPILKDILDEVQMVSNQQYLQDKANYEQALIEENNWEIDYKAGSKDRIESFKTPDGRVRVNLNDSKNDGSGEELMSMDFLPDYMDYIDLSKVSINGVTLDKVETLKNSSNLITEDDTGYFQISIADYTTLTARYNYEGKLTDIIISREQYSLR